MPYDPAEAATLFLQALQDILATPGNAHAIAEKAISAHVMARMGVAAVPEGRIGVKIPPLSQGERGWAKWVLGINSRGKGGYLFEGPFLRRGKMAVVWPGSVVVWTAVDPQNNRNVGLLAFLVNDNTAPESMPSPSQVWSRAMWPDLARLIGERFNLARARAAPVKSGSPGLPGV